MQQYIRKIVWVCLLVVPFIALHVATAGPFDVLAWFGAGQLFFPFISGKNILFRVLVEIAFAGWAILALSDAKYRINIKKSPIIIAYTAFILVLLVADIFGIDREKSMWSNFERMEGFVGHIHLFAYFFVLTVMVKTLSEWQRMWKFFIGGNILVLIYGFFQFVGAKGLIFSILFPSLSARFSAMFPIHQSGDRIDATIGNSAYFGVFCLMYVFIAAILWAQSQEPKKAWWYPALIFANIAGVFYSGTRGSIIGLLIGGLITLGILAIVQKGKLRNLFIKVLVVTVVAVSSLFIFKDAAIIKNSPTLSRLATISLSEGTGGSRIAMWTISYEAFKERPLLGYGQDNFSHIFARKFLPAQMCNLEPWYDRSHDVFFDWLMAGGILGLLTYLSLYGVTLWYMWRRENDMPVLEKAIITGALAGYFIHNIFVFDNLTSYILFFALLAYVTVRTKDGVTHGKAIISGDSMNYLVAPLIGIALLVTFYYVNYRPILVNKLVIKGMSINQYAQIMPFADAVKLQQESFEQAIAMDTLGSIEAREQYLQIIPRMAQIKLPESMPQGDKQAAVQALNNLIASGRKEVAQSFPRYQNDVRMMSLYGMFLLGVGDYVTAEEVLTKTHAIAPKKQLVTYDLIRAKLLQQKYAETYPIAKETYDSGIKCDNAQKWFLVSAAYAGKYKEAKEYVVSKGQQVNLDQDVLSALVVTNQKPQAIEMLEDLKKQNPEKATEIDTYIKQLQALAPAK